MKISRSWGQLWSEKESLGFSLDDFFFCFSYTQPAAPTLLGNATILENNFLPCQTKD